MSPLRWQNESVAENVGAPLVTPGAGTAQRNPPRMEFRRKWEPRHPPAPANPARYPGDMNVAPTWAKRIRRGKRGGATCDARCRRGTTESAANGIPPQTVNGRDSPANGEPRHPFAPANPACHPGDMNVAPTWADCAKPRRGATCDARCRHGTMEFVRKRNPVRECEPRHSPANGNHGIRPLWRIPPVIRAT